LAHPPAAEPATLAQVDVVELSVEDSISKMADTAIKKLSSLDGAAVIGFSMGGMVAMEIARSSPGEMSGFKWGTLRNENSPCPKQFVVIHVQTIDRKSLVGINPL
jgi:dienelactone hydrolase